MSSYLLIFILCFIFSFFLLWVLKYWLPTGFLAAGITARSNHITQARQIGGLACIPVCISAILIAGISDIIPLRLGISLFAAGALLWITGYLDDKKELSVRLRLPAQFVAAIIALYGLGENFRLLPDLLPHWLEAVLLTIAVVSSINVANFMDGLDWMTVAGIGIPLFSLALIVVCFLQSPEISIIGFALSGALAGFAIFNRPPASIFLGDSGSLPLGMLTGAAFLLFAKQAGIIPALILPLYYIADSASTIILRLRKRENILLAHSAHAYQIAKRSGKSVTFVTGSIAVLNVILGLITAIIIKLNTNSAYIGGLFIAALLATLLILYFRKMR